MLMLRRASISLALPLALLAVALSAGRAGAAPMAYEFSGVIDSVANYDGMLDGSIQSGTGFSGRFTFDSNAPDSDPTLRGVYRGASFSMAVDMGSYSWFSGAGNGHISVRNNYYGDDSLLLGADPFSAGGNVRIYFISGYLLDSTGGVFSSAALPIAPFSLSSFDQRSFEVRGNALVGLGGFKVQGTFTGFTIVPEPSSILGVACILASIAGYRTRRRVFD